MSISADVYGVAPHVGRGGWTWYTGSSGWMYRLGLEGILGMRRAGAGLIIEPHPRRLAGLRSHLSLRPNDLRHFRAQRRIFGQGRVT